MMKMMKMMMKMLTVEETIMMMTDMYDEDDNDGIGVQHW
jgi:hypothetical protein